MATAAFALLSFALCYRFAAYELGVPNPGPRTLGLILAIWIAGAFLDHLIAETARILLGVQP